MTNFERATKRMQSRGCRPFQPDHATCQTSRWVRDADMPPEVAQESARMDALLGALAIGFVLGMLVQGLTS